MTEIKEKIQWQIQLLVDPELKSKVVKICRERRIRIPVFVSALIEKTFSDSELLESCLEREDFPKSYQRLPKEPIVAEPEVGKKQRLDPTPVPAVSEAPKKAAEGAPRANPKQLIEKVLKSRDPQPSSHLATVHPISSAKGQPVEAEIKKVSEAVVPKVISIRPSLEARKTDWDHLCEMKQLPGEYFDEEIEKAQADWEETWGEPTEAEFDQMVKAVEVRLEVFAEWRNRYHELTEAVTVAEKAVEEAKRLGKSVAAAKRKLYTANSNLQVFKTRTQWDERDMDASPPLERAPKKE